MPLTAKLIALLLVGASLTACRAPASIQSNTFGNQPSASDSTLTPPGASFTETVGGFFRVVLPSAGDGGYAWHLDDTYNQSVVHLLGEHPGSLPPNPTPGQFAPEVFEFEADAQGATTLHFSQYRSFESPSAAIATATHPLTVQ